MSAEDVKKAAADAADTVDKGLGEASKIVRSSLAWLVSTAQQGLDEGKGALSQVRGGLGGAQRGAGDGGSRASAQVPAAMAVGPSRQQPQRLASHRRRTRQTRRRRC